MTLKYSDLLFVRFRRRFSNQRRYLYKIYSKTFVYFVKANNDLYLSNKAHGTVQKIYLNIILLTASSTLEYACNQRNCSCLISYHALYKYIYVHWTLKDFLDIPLTFTITHILALVLLQSTQNETIYDINDIFKLMLTYNFERMLLIFINSRYENRDILITVKHI